MDDEPEPEYVEMLPAAYLRDLAERLLHIPVMHGVDGYDHDPLRRIANEMPGEPDAGAAP